MRLAVPHKSSQVKNSFWTAVLFAIIIKTEFCLGAPGCNNHDEKSIKECQNIGEQRGRRRSPRLFLQDARRDRFRAYLWAASCLGETRASVSNYFEKLHFETT